MVPNYKIAKREGIKLFDIAVLAYIFVAVSGSTNDLHTYFSFAICVCVLFWLLMKKRFRFGISDKRLICAGFFLLFILVFGLPVGRVFFTLKQVGAAIIRFSPMFLFMYYRKQYGTKSFDFVLKGLIVIMVYYMVVAYNAYTSLGVNARRIADHTGEYGEMAIGGGYFLAYAAALLGVFVFDCLYNKKFHTTSSKIFATLLVILSFLVVYETLSTITLIAYVFGIFISLLLPAAKRYENGKSNLGVIVVASMFLLIAIVIVLPIVGTVIIKLSSGGETIMQKRLQDFGYLLTGTGDGSYAVGRMSIPLKSFKTFLKNPIIGICYQHGNGFYKASLFGAGNHCDWVDALCNYGLVGGVPLLYIFFKTLRTTYHKTRRMGLGYAATFLMLGLFNPFICVHTTTVVFLIIPMMVETFNRREAEMEGEI